MIYLPSYIYIYIERERERERESVWISIVFFQFLASTIDEKEVNLSKILMFTLFRV